MRRFLHFFFGARWDRALPATFLIGLELLVFSNLLAIFATLALVFLCLIIGFILLSR